MKPVQILMDDRLLEAVDRASRRLHVDRSKLIRTALAEFLEIEGRRRLDREDREAYERTPQEMAELRAWERIQAWPEK